MPHLEQNKCQVSGYYCSCITYLHCSTVMNWYTAQDYWPPAKPDLCVVKVFAIEYYMIFSILL